MDQVQDTSSTCTDKDDLCFHKWEGYESMGTNEYREDVKCITCGIFGERDWGSKEVVYPVT